VIDAGAVAAAGAALGGVAWLILVVTALEGGVSLGATELLFLLAPLVVVPLGFRIAGPGGRLLRVARVLQPPAAVLALAAFGVAPGRRAAALACSWLLVSGLAALSGAPGLLRQGWRLDEATCAAAGRVYLAGGAGWFVLSRLGATPLGFGEPIVLLTAIHFHYAGFATSLVAAATLRAARRVARLHRGMEVIVVAGVVAGPALVAAGFLTTEAVSLGATLVLAACLCLLARQMWICRPHIAPRLSRVLLVISSGSIVVAMVLAAVYAWSELARQAGMSIPRMVRLHGLLNAVGFAVCGLLAWNLEGSSSRVRPCPPSS